MNLYRHIQALKAEIIETEKMLILVKDHPIMSVSFQEKINSLKNELDKLPKDVKEPRVQLLFSGLAVVGSSGIKSSFLGKTLKAFQEIVKTQTSLVKYGNVPKRGRAKSSSKSDLFITALPTGSFGVELTQLEQNELFEGEEVGQAIYEVMELIHKICSNEEEFEKAIANTPKRNISNLMSFFKEINDEKSFLKMQTGDFQLEVQFEDVRTVYSRLSATQTKEDDLFINGIFRGVLLDSGRFEIKDVDGKKYAGFIGESIDENTLIDYDQNLINENCTFHLKVNNITFSNGNNKITYELLEIKLFGE